MNARHLDELSNKGVAWAQARLGTYYIQGIEGVEQSLTRAYDLVESAAKQGHKQAQFDAALMNFEGIGCEIDTEKGINFLIDSAKQFNADAQLRLANYYLSKTKNYEAAYFYYLLYLDCSDKVSSKEQASLADIRSHIDEPKAVQIYNEAKALVDQKPTPSVELLEYSGVYLSMIQNDQDENGINITTENDYFPPALEVAKDVVGQMSA